MNLCSTEEPPMVEAYFCVHCMSFICKRDPLSDVFGMGQGQFETICVVFAYKRILSNCTVQVKRFRHHSNNSLSSLDHPHNLTNGTRSHPPIRHIPVKRRRSSIAIMEVGNIPHVPATPIEAVQVNTRDPKLAVMERQRKTSWSKVVGSSECRSIDTGLNELDRISGERMISSRYIEKQLAPSHFSTMWGKMAN